MVAHIMLSGAAACFRFSNYFSDGPCFYFPLLRGRFLAGVIVDPSLHFRVRSDGKIPERTCSQFVCAHLADHLKPCCATYSVMWWHCLCCPTLGLNELNKNIILILGLGGGRSKHTSTHWFSRMHGRVCWHGVCCAGGTSPEGSAGLC